MLLIVRVQVDFAKRHRERTGSYPAGALRGNLAFEGHISTRTLIRRLHHQGMRARRPIKRPQLTLRHRHARIDWSHDRLGWTIRTWRRVHWSVTPYRWSCKGMAPTKHVISGPHFGDGGVTVWGCFSFDCKLDLYVLDGNLTGQNTVTMCSFHAWSPIATIMRWLTGQCSWTTTLGNIEPELYNILYNKRLFRKFHGLRCRQT